MNARSTRYLMSQILRLRRPIRFQKTRVPNVWWTVNWAGTFDVYTILFFLLLIYRRRQASHYLWIVNKFDIGAGFMWKIPFLRLSKTSIPKAGVLYKGGRIFRFTQSWSSTHVFFFSFFSSLNLYFKIKKNQFNMTKSYTAPGSNGNRTWQRANPALCHLVIQPNWDSQSQHDDGSSPTAPLGNSLDLNLICSNRQHHYHDTSPHHFLQ